MQEKRSWKHVKYNVRVLTTIGSLVLLLSLSCEPTILWFENFWSGSIDDSEVSLKEPGNLAISFWTSPCEESDFSLQSSASILLLAATNPEVAKVSAPVEILGASSGFLLAFTQAARWARGPECEAFLGWHTWESILSVPCDGLGGSIGKPEASSGCGLNFSLRLFELEWLCLFCNKYSH